MIKFFRKIRQKLLTENKFIKYLLYAIGEIALVMIGILLALQVNNWNEERKDQNKLLKIYNIILNDIKNDKQELIRNVKFYSQQESVFKKVLYDSITPDLLEHGLSRLLGHSPSTILNRTGVNQLRELQNKDSLTLKIIGVYDAMETRMLKLENRMTNEMTDHSKHVRDTYEWYPEWINNTIMKDVGSKKLHNYFLTSSIYKNRVISVYQTAYNNYVPMLNDMIEQITKLEAGLNSILKK